MAESIKRPACQHCQQPMKYMKQVEKNMTLQLLGVLLAIIGIALMFAAFPIGILIGPIVLIVAARLGYSKAKGWKCPNCGYFFKAKI